MNDKQIAQRFLNNISRKKLSFVCTNVNPKIQKMLSRMLEKDLLKRITVEEALQDELFKQFDQSN